MENQTVPFVTSGTQFADMKNLDLRVPENSPLITMECYTQGESQGVKLSIIVN
jgi:hypothetical protein